MRLSQKPKFDTFLSLPYLVFFRDLYPSSISTLVQIQVVDFFYRTIPNPVVQLGPGLKSETKALDQSRTLNSLWTTTI